MTEFIANNWFWVAIAVGSGSLLIYQLFKGNTSNDVDTVQATTMINREHARIVDVRSTEDFEKGHIQNAINLPIDRFSQRMSELEKFKDRVIVVCCKSGTSSKNACSSLRKAGFNRAHSLTGGISAWEQAGLPLARKGKK